MCVRRKVGACVHREVGTEVAYREGVRESLGCRRPQGSGSTCPEEPDHATG